MTVALVARREARLQSVAAEVESTGGSAVAIAADISQAAECDRAVAEALAHLGSIDVLVNAAGTNIPRRRLDALSVADWDRVVATNLSGAFYLVRAVLPVLHRDGGGVIVHISSLAGDRPSALSGAAYSASKAGLNALSACTNLEEGAHGIRSCVISPGDIDTELLEQRPFPPDAESRSAMLRPEDVAALVATVVQQPPHALVEEILVRPRPVA
jgi:NADP-dependent 3-hydroxy acid dehydrogenase YdfG